MTTDELRTALTDALADRQLLQHPFYQRWEAGTLRPGELGAYAAQYRYFEAALPGLLRELLTRLEPGSAFDLVQSNLTDEESNPEPHVTAFAGFAEAAQAPDAPPGDATRRLIGTYQELVDSSGPEALAAVVAYEMQAPGIAASKSSGLRRHYGFDAQGTRFWDIHTTMDVDHAEWGMEALAALDAPRGEVVGAARRAADAWWSFLDERESEALLTA